MKEKKKKINLKPAGSGKKKVDYKWVFKIVVWTFALSMTFNFVSSTVISDLSLAGAFLILLVIIFTGIFFDVIGIAVATATEHPFHSLAARKNSAAQSAILLIRNAEKVSNFCNDVVGDIAGIVSGATGAIIVEFIASEFKANVIVVSLLVTGTIAGLTVGGKAIGKTAAMTQSNSIVYFVANIICVARRVPSFFKRKR